MKYKLYYIHILKIKQSVIKPIEINIFVRTFRLFLRNMCPSGMLFIDEVHNLKVYSVVIFVLFEKKTVKKEYYVTLVTAGTYP